MHLQTGGMKNLRSTLFISFDCGNQGHARPHTEENRLASPKSGESFAADRCMQQIELGLLKKEATDFFKTEVFCQALCKREPPITGIMPVVVRKKRGSPWQSPLSHQEVE